MADNLDVTPGTGATIAANEIGGVKYQRVKISIGAAGSAADLAPGQTTKSASVPVTLASDDDLQGKLGALTETAPASDTASSGLNGRLQRIAQNLTSFFGVKVTAIAALATGGVGVIGWLSQIWDKLNTQLAFGQSAKTSSHSVTIASDDDLQGKVGSLTETAPASDTASSGLNGRLQRIAQNLTSMPGTKVTAIAALATGGVGIIGWLSQIWDKLNTALTFGQGAKAASLPVTIASDDDLQGKLGALTETAPASDTASSGLNGRLQRIAQNQTSGFGTKVTAIAALATGGVGVIGWLSQIWDKLNTLLPAALGQGTMAQSMRVVLASDQSALNIAATAGENHIGAIGGNTSYIDVTLSLDTSAYATGDLMADTQVVTNAMRVNDGTGMLASILVLDEDDQGIGFDIVFLSANNTLGTENSAPSVSDANARDILGIISVASSEYIDLGGCRVATKTAIGLAVKPASGTRNLYLATITRGAPTYSASGVRLRLGFLQD